MGSLKSSLGKVARSLAVPPRRITWGSQLATGYDRLKYGLYVAWERPEILLTLADAKERAKEINEPVTISFTEHGDLVFNCHPTGRKGGYAYHISRSDVNIFFSTRKDNTTPNIWVDIGSQSCWSPGYNNIIKEVKRLVATLGGHIVKDVVSEVHLCSDFVGLDIEELPIDRSEHWVTRANRFHCYQDRTRLSGITIAQTMGELPPGDKDSIVLRETGISFGTGDIMLRIYDKSLELKRSATKQSVFASVWQQDEYDEKPVTRVEYQLRRDVLRQLHVNTLSDLKKKRSGVWKYCTQEWTRFALEPVDRKNRHQDRAALHPWWREVQKADFKTPLVELSRIKIQPSRNINTLLDMSLGCLMSAQTIRGVTPTIENVIAQSQAFIEEGFRRLHKEKTIAGKNLFDHKMKLRFANIWPMGFQPSFIQAEWAMG
jgi:hypothetical protein